MKKSALLLLAFFVCTFQTLSSDIAIDEATFPDPNFRAWLMEQDYGQDGVLTDGEIQDITEINVNSKGIKSLEGIEFFTALEELNCSENQLTALDVSKNTALTKLYCWVNQLTALDVSKNTALTELVCLENQLTALDVSKNTALTLLGCGGNPLTALDVSKNTALTLLECELYQLTALDVSKNTALEKLDCDGSQLTALDVSKNTALEVLGCSSNQLTELDVSKNTALRDLSCYGNHIRNEGMEDLIESLPNQKRAYLYVYVEDYEAMEMAGPDGNVCTKEQVAAAKAKGWTVYYHTNGRWQEYEGREEGSEINETTLSAYEYFTIYFSNGTKSETFYATDVDSICYSKIGLDSLEYADWQVQEIYTCDSVYRYPLSQIDSLSFKNVDVNIVAEDINRASSVIVPLYAQYESAADLSQHLSTIRNVEGVENAWVDGQALYVYIRDYGTITFIYPPKASVSDASHVRAMQMTASKSALSSAEHNQTDIGRVCIFNHMAKDNDPGFDDARWVVKELKEMYDKMGIPCDVPDVVQPDFFENQMFDYDQLFIITHGNYDMKSKTHWLATDKEILCITNPGLFSISAQLWVDYLNLLHYSTNKLRIVSHSETRNGIKCVVFYVAISEHLISSAKNHFQNTNAMVFNAACESLKGNLSQQGEKAVDYSMGNTFVNKGASCYFGYDDTNRIGRYGGFEFFQALLNGSCVESSYNLIDNVLKEEQFDGYHPILRTIVKKPNLRVLQTETLESENEQTNNSIKISGRIKKVDSDIIHVEKLQLTIPGLKDEYNYGFQLSINPDMSGSDYKEADAKNHDESTLYMKWEKTLDEKDLQPNTTYYYRAYMNDGYSNCYGEIKSFKTKDPNANARAYVVLDNTNKIATYYYDGKYESRRGGAKYLIDIKKCFVKNNSKVIFDESFSNCYPRRFSFEGCGILQTIENIEYLNTDSITDMSFMFARCRSLTSLDLSSFNTSNVTDMSYMFTSCSSLASLDVSSFDTSNVTGMHGMFNICSSLASLDVSSFDTSNVTNMHGMFDSCSSLTSLDLSSFNTSNVTDMSYMFWECYSLMYLDLSSFNTANVTDMSFMFDCCRSLTSLDVSHFNTSNVTNMSMMFRYCVSIKVLDLSSFYFANRVKIDTMFENCRSLMTIYASCDWNAYQMTYGGSGPFLRCNNLVGGKGTKIGENLYGYDANGTPLYYDCYCTSRAARIDRGKDGPGLFTAK